MSSHPTCPRGGGLTLCVASLAVLPAVEKRVFDVTTFGAQEDGATLNTKKKTDQGDAEAKKAAAFRVP